MPGSGGRFVGHNYALNLTEPRWSGAFSLLYIYMM